MDGNGRWAQARSHMRTWGHVRGSGVVSRIVEEADDLGIRALTLYAFSTENWSRPKKEIMTLFKLLKKFLNREKRKIFKNKICFRVIGDISNLPLETQKEILDMEDKTRHFQGLKLSFAFDYGGHSEIVKAVNDFIDKNPNQKMNEKKLASFLFAPDTGNVDLLIRTGGEQRISNFLLWKIAYAELYFTPTPWPEFKVEEFRKIIEKVSLRERRFGDIESSSEIRFEERSDKAQINKKEISHLDPHQGAYTSC